MSDLTREQEQEDVEYLLGHGMFQQAERMQQAIAERDRAVACIRRMEDALTDELVDRLDRPFNALGALAEYEATEDVK